MESNEKEIKTRKRTIISENLGIFGEAWQKNIIICPHRSRGVNEDEQ
jgi:hypothetical protein